MSCFHPQQKSGKKNEDINKEKKKMCISFPK